MSFITAVGMKYRGHHSFRPGNIYQLEADPTNPYDSNAIKIMYKGRHVAFVARNTQSRAEIGRDYTMQHPDAFSRDYCDLEVVQEVPDRADEVEGKTKEDSEIIRTQRERIEELENELQRLRAQQSGAAEQSRAKRAREGDGEDSRPSQKIKTSDGERN